MVADGIGGHENGRKAARTCAAQFAQFVKAPEFQRLKAEGFQKGFNEDMAWLLLKQIIDKANQMIYDEVVSKDISMGTTCTAAIVRVDKAGDFAGTCFFAHVGDSRIYQISEAISQLSTDHTLKEAKHLLTNFVGLGPQIKIDVGTTRLSPGSALLLSTDGLHNHALDDSEFVRSTILRNSPARACKRLMRRAERNGATDNMSLVLVRLPGEFTQIPEMEGVEHAASLFL